jgi:hypothetical protein
MLAIYNVGVHCQSLDVFEDSVAYYDEGGFLRFASKYWQPAHSFLIVESTITYNLLAGLNGRDWWVLFP